MGEIRDFKSSRQGEPPSGATPRRLAAIVAGDIAGYSRLMELDEEGTHGRVKRIERDLIEPSITEHNGKLVKTTGDGFIAIFDSPVEAVRCSIVIQQNLVGRNASLPTHYRIEYRIGVNLGDVIIEADDVYGDGVNIASRLEGIADPGQVYISGGIYEQIKHKLVCGYESLGDRKVKNITDPVRVYRVLPDVAAFHKTRKRRENILIFLLSTALLIIAGGVLWYMLLQPYRKVADQGSAPVAPSAQSPALPAPPAKQAASQPATPPSAAQQPSPQPHPVPSGVPAPKQGELLPQPASPAPPAAPSVQEPEMKALQGGSFAMGSNDDISERPIHQVTIKPFSISIYPITVRQWNECAAAKACGFVATGKDDAPIANVSWSDAKQYVAWLADATRKPYRLPS
jgi:class 3 adenylate cyclase